MPSIVAKVKTGIKQAINRVGYHCARPLLVIESDDWGSIRVPSVDVLRDYQRHFPEHVLNYYQVFDTLDTADDLESLSAMLRGFVNDSGEHPLITMNYAMANPVFDGENSALGSPFRYETITNTYLREQGANSSLSLMLSGKYDDVFRAQLHGREHLNVTTWRKGIANSKRLEWAYSAHMIGLDPGTYNGLDVLNKNNTEIDSYEYLAEACRLFSECFGYESESYIPPCYTLNRRHERCLAELGVHVLQSGSKINRTLSNGATLSIPTPMGATTSFDQVRIVRNVQFEPSRRLFEGHSAESIVEETFDAIRRVVDNEQPVVICSHRVNYVGGISVQNRDASLECLSRVLAMVLNEYPSMTFLSSDQLGRQIMTKAEG